jgi:hypothetical protein
MLMAESAPPRAALTMKSNVPACFCASSHERPVSFMGPERVAIPVRESTT